MSEVETTRIINKNKKKDISLRYLVLAILFWLLTFTCILVIFLLSSEEGEVSNSTSTLLQGKINNTFNIFLISNDSLRDLAHVTEYGGLTLLAFLAIDFTNRISKKKSYSESPLKIIKSDNEMNIIFAGWFAIINALADEYHQLFVNGRNGNFGDVLKDLIGIILVLAIIRLVFSIYLASKGRKEVRYN